MTTLTNAAPAITRDRYGRPLVIPPQGGKPVPYTRCTTYVDAIEDKIGLQRWMMRMTAVGLANRPDLLLGVSAHLDDKRELDRLCEAAKEAAAASAAATTGTAIHALTELIDRGRDLPPLPPQAAADLDAYRAATVDLTAVMIEQFSVLDTLKIGGTPDRVVTYQGQRYIADIKTGSIDFGTLKIASQLAVYARARPYDIATGERSYHEADTSRGIIIHVPAGQGTATLHWVDIEAGWYAVQVAGQVRDKRKLKFRDLTEPFGPLPIEPRPGTVRGNTAMLRQKATAAAAALVDAPPLVEQIAACVTADDVRALWTAHQDEWTDELTKAGAVRVAELGRAS